MDLPGVKLFGRLQPPQFLTDTLVMDHSERSENSVRERGAEHCVGRRFKPLSIHVGFERFVYSSRCSLLATIFPVATKDSENSEPRHQCHTWIGDWVCFGFGRSQDIGSTIRFLVHD